MKWIVLFYTFTSNMEMEDTHMDIDSKVCVIIVRGYYT